MTHFRELAGTRWRGTSRLWLAPDAPAEESEATLAIEEGEVRYTWSRQGRPHQGRITVGGQAGGEWTDDWHNPSPMALTPASGSPALFCLVGRYAAPPGPDWFWRILLALRPDGELVLQMANVCPWGEEQRAVEIVARRDAA